MDKGSGEDRFRWLEQDSEETRAWQDGKNREADAYFARFAGMTSLRARVGALLETGFCDAPVSAGGLTFYVRREGSAQQPSVMVRDADGRERVLIDVAALSSDATDAVDWWYPSPNGKLLAWGLSQAGSEQSTLHIRDVSTGRDLDERIGDTQHCTVAWRDDETFFYSRHPPSDPYHSRVYVHHVGVDPARDLLVFGQDRDKTDIPQPLASPCGRYLVVVVQQGWSRSELWVKDLEGPTGFMPIAHGEDAMFDVVVRPDAFYVVTNSGAPRSRVFRVSWDRPARDDWQEVVPEGPDVLTGLAVSGTTLVTSYLRQASSVVVLREGEPREVRLPTLGSAAVYGLARGDDVFVTFTSFAYPLGIWSLDGSELRPWASVAAAPPDDVLVERRSAVSRDGTDIPMFVVRRRSTKLPARAVLYGYGGFNVNQTPTFSARVLAFVERGGVWVSTVLRGGGELGEAWHQAGMRDRKQNVFDDFYACAEAVVADGITTHLGLAAMGGSNGGLLVCVAMTQRPELFGAGVALVPLADMLRYHLFRLGAYWTDEYGSPDDPVASRWLRAYSPIHNITSRPYPAVLLWAAESDSRVDPMHARKMAAALSKATTSSRPIVLRVETKAGHGMGKPVGKIADQLAAEIAFLETELSP